MGVDTLARRRTVNQDSFAVPRMWLQSGRFPLSRLLGLLAAGQSRDEILRAYPYLEAPDIDEALHCAASLAEDETIELTG